MKHLALFAGLLAACAKTDSSDLLTSGMYAQLEAETKGDGTTHVSATLYVGNPIHLNFVDLTGDDELVASHGGQHKVMTEIVLLNIVGHHASFQTDAEGAEFDIAFVRTVDDGAPSSVATLPAKFTVDPGPTTASRAAPLTLTWSPAATLDLMSWSAYGDCIDTTGAMITGDTGTVTIAPDSLRKRQGQMVPDQCNVTVEIARSRSGTVDRGYGKGGTFHGRQVRTVMFSSTP